MANQIKYQVGFDIQQNNLNQLKSSLQQIKKINLNDIMKINNSDIKSASDALKNIQQDATKVENALNKAFNAKLNTINIQTFNKELSSSNLTIEKIHQSFSQAGIAGQTAFNNLSTQILNTNVQLRQSSKLLDSMATSMANTVKWGITSSIFNNMTGAIQKAYYYAKDLDQSLTDIRIVTGDSADQMERFAQTANGAARDLGRSTLDYTKAALTFYQQGLNDTEVQARTEATLKAENITGIGAEMADYLTAVWNGFKVGAEDAEEYVDKLAAVADSTASDMGQLATAISKVASAANSVGVDIDQLNGQIATVIATTRQAPESVGVAFKTIYARINDIKAGTDEAQISLGNYSSKMAQLGFNVLDASGHLRDTGEVIEEIGGSWQDLSREQQIYLAQTMAGQRQYNNLIALFDNWDQYIQSVNTSLSAQGTLNEKNDRYLESLEAHMQQLGAEAERTYDILFDENTVKGWVDALGGALNIFNDFISGIGGGTNAFTYFASLVVGIFNKQIAQAIQGVGTEINRFFANIQAFNSKQKIINQIKSGLQAAWAGEGKNLGNNALTAQAQAAEKTLAVQKGLTIEQQKQAVQIQKQIGLETQRTQDLKQKLADEQRENQLARDRLGLDAQEKRLNDQQLQDLQNKLIYYKQIQSEAQKLLSIFTQTEIAIEDENVNEEKRNQLAQQFRSQQELINQAYRDAGGTQQHFTELWQKACNEIRQGKGHLQAFNEIQNLIRGQTKETQEVIQAINTLLKNQTSNTQEQLQASQRVTKEYQNQNNLLAEQGKRTINLQTMIRGMSAAGQILSAWAGAAKTFGDQMATAQQKANATISGIQGTISGIGMMFGPVGLGISTLVNGVISFVKEVTPLGDILENHFKTAQQRIDELNESISAVNSNDKTKNAQIGELESLVEEYQKLSEKAGDYGINLDKLTQQEQDRYHEITDTFAEYNDAVIAGYDEQGHAIVKGQDALKDTIEVLKQAKLQADKAALGDKGDFLNNIALRHENEKQSTYQALEDEENSIKQEFNNKATKNWDVDITQIRDNLDYFVLDYQEKYREVAEDIRNQIGPLTEEQSSFISESFQQSFLKLTEEIQAAANSGDIFLLQDAVQKASQFRDTIRNITGDQSLFGDIYDSLFTSFSVSEEDEQNYLRKINEIHKNRQELDKQIAEQIYSPQDANALITGLQVYDNETWSIIEDGLKQLGLTPSGFVKQLSDLITEQNISTDINQVYDLIQQKAESYAQILVSYGSAIEKAEKDAVQDAKKIFEEDKTAKDLNQSILDSIQQYFLSDETIKSLLADSEQHPEYKEFLESLIKSIYNLDDVEISLDQSGNAVINTVKTQRDKINQEILDIFSDKTHQKIPEQLKDYFSNLIIDEDTLLAIKNAAADPEQTFGDLQSAFNWVKNFIKDVDRQVDVQPIIDKFNKISIAIERIQKGKDLTWQEKNGLVQALNLKPQELAELNTNADWLQEITEKVYTTLNPDIPEQGAARKQAFADLYSDLQSLRQAYEHPLKGVDGVMKMTTQEFGDVWDVVYQKELDALNLDQAALQNWATNRGMIFDGVEKNTQKALNAYKIEKDAESLQKLAQTVKEAGDKVDTSSEEFIELQTQLQLLTGDNWTAQNVISMLDMIAAYTDDGVQKFQTYAEWLDYIKNNGPEQTSQMSAASRYKEDKTSLDNLQGASKSLTDRSQINEDQSKALAQLLTTNEQLNILAETQGVNSREFLEVLNEIIAVKQYQLELSKEQALQQNQQKIKEAQELLQARDEYGHKLIQGQQAEKEVQQEINSLIQERMILLQDLSEKEFDSDVDIQQLEELSNNIQNLAPQSEQLADSLAKDEEAADNLAQSILRFDDACQNVVDSYDDWMKALQSDSIQQQTQAMAELREAYADLLNLDGGSLSEDFLSNTENLDLMKAAIDGDIDAYDELMRLAQQDIATQVHLDIDDFQSNFDALMNQYYEGQTLDDLEIGASLNNEGFLNGLSQMINAAGMTAQQATDYLASMGVDAEVVQTKTTAKDQHQYTGVKATVTDQPFQGTDPLTGFPITYHFPNVSYETVPVDGEDNKENTAYSLKVKSANKSSGGGFKFNNASNGGGSKGNARRAPSGKGGKGGGKGGKGGKGGGKGQKPDKSKKDLKEPLEDQRDLYHDINIQLKQTERSLDRIQKMQDRLYGKQLLDNLAKQKKLLEQQRDVLERKQKIQQQDLKQQQQTLKNLGVTFDQYGNIANYMNIIGQKQNTVNALIAEENRLIKDYNNTTKKEAKEALSELITEQQKKVKDAEDDLKKTQDKIKDYDKLREDMEDVVDQIEELTQQEIELNIKTFRMEVQIRLKLGEAERDWNKFRRQVLEKTDLMHKTDFDDIYAGMDQSFNDLYSYFDVHGSAGTIETLTNKLLETREEIEKIDSIGQSAIYGDNKAKAMQDLQNDLKQLMEQMGDIEKLIDDIDQAYLDTIDDIEKQFDKQIEDYEYITELIQHDMDLLQLLYGDKNYEAMAKYYETLQQGNLKQLDSLKQQRNFWKEQWDAAVARGDTNAAEKFKENYKKTITDLNKTIEQSAKILKDKYANSIQAIFDSLDKKLSNGRGTDYLQTQWDLINKNADEYLDTINAAFAVQQAERKYRKALDDTKSIKNQQALKKLMNEQLDILKNKEKISQYDVDRTEKVLQLEQARIALEQAQAAKTSLRLKRDAQGNYSYQYAADSASIDDAQSNYDSAFLDLHNLDADQYKTNQEKMLSAYQEYIDKRKEILEKYAGNQEEQIKRIALLDEEYGEYVNDRIADNFNIRLNLMESTFKSFAHIYQTDVANYQQMAEDEKQILMENLVPTWNTGVEQMAETIAGEGGLLPACEQGFEEVADATQAYQEELDELATAAGINLDDVQKGVDDTAEEFEKLVQKNDDLLLRMNEEIDTVGSLREAAKALATQYGAVYTAAKQAASAIHEFIQAQQKAAAAANGNNSGGGNSSGSSSSGGNPSGSSSSSGSGSGSKSSGSSSGGGSGSGSGSGGGSGSGSGTNSGSRSTTTQNLLKKRPLTGCFSAGTKILMADHTVKNIEDVKINDIVIAYNDEKEQYEQRKVQKTFIHPNAIDLVEVLLSNGIIMSMTPGHPVLTTEGWKSLDLENSIYEHGVKTTLLKINDEVLGYFGNAFVKEIINVDIPADYIVYNLEVESCHTFLANGMVVHNAKAMHAYATGGYTGDWNSDEGKLAILHEKELVLNKEDTQNMLNSIGILRQITTHLSGSMLQKLSNIDIRTLINGRSEDKQGIEQDVHIEASFPNVNSKREIEEAFSELVNLAAQRIMR